MKKLKENLRVSVLSILVAGLFFSSGHRLVIVGITSASLLCLVNHAAAYPTPEQQAANATQSVTSPAFSMSSSFVSSAINSIASTGHGQKKGLQFKSPVASGGFTTRLFDDTIAGGFGGEEYSGDLGVDADVYDGLIAGLIYQYVYRGAHNAFGTSEHLNSNGISLFGAKRLFDLLNVGLAYNYVGSDHKLTRAVNTNLDRDAYGFTVFSGVSDRKGKWSWAATPSFGYIYDDYDQQKDLETGRFTLGGTLGYDVSKKFTIAAALNYHHFVFQDMFPGSTARDDNYWTIGPQLQFFPSDQITVHLDFESQQDYIAYTAYTLRLGVDVAF